MPSSGVNRLSPQRNEPDPILRTPMGVAIGRGDFPNAIKRGQSRHFDVYSDWALGELGAVIAAGVVERCEQDFKALRNWFGNVDPPKLPIQVIIADLDGNGAYHNGCAGVDIYCDA